MTFQTSLVSSGTFFQRCSRVLSNSDQLIEGGMWGTWFVFNACNLKGALREKEKVASAQLSQQQKTEKLWNAKKEVFLNCCSFFSAGTMVLSWLAEVKIFPLGIFGTFFNVGGYGGSALVSSIRTFEAAVEIDRGMSVFSKIKDPRAKSDIALRQLQNLFHLAFQASLCAWSALGMAYSVVNSLRIFAAMDMVFCAVLGLFFINLGFALFLPSLLYSKQKIYHS